MNSTESDAVSTQAENRGRSIDKSTRKSLRHPSSRDRNGSIRESLYEYRRNSSRPTSPLAGAQHLEQSRQNLLVNNRAKHADSGKRQESPSEKTFKNNLNHPLEDDQDTDTRHLISAEKRSIPDLKNLSILKAAYVGANHTIQILQKELLRSNTNLARRASLSSPATDIKRSKTELGRRATFSSSGAGVKHYSNNHGDKYDLAGDEDNDAESVSSYLEIDKNEEIRRFKRLYENELAMKLACEEKIKELTDKIEVLESERHSFETKNGEGTENPELLEEINNLRQISVDTLSQLAKTQYSIGRTQDSYIQLLSHQHEKTKLESQIENLRQKLDKEKASIEQAKRSSPELSDKLRKRNEYLEGTFAGLRGTVDELNILVQRLRNEKLARQEEPDRSGRFDLPQHVVEMQLHNEKVREIEAKRDRDEAMKQEIESLKRENSQLKEHKHELIESTRVLEVEIQRLEETNKTIVPPIRSMVASLSIPWFRPAASLEPPELRNQLDDAVAENNALHNRILVANLALSESKDECDSSNRKANEAITNYDNLLSEYQELQREMEVVSSISEQPSNFPEFPEGASSWRRVSGSESAASSSGPWSPPKIHFPSLSGGQRSQKSNFDSLYNASLVGVPGEKEETVGDEVEQTLPENSDELRVMYETLSKEYERLQVHYTETIATHKETKRDLENLRKDHRTILSEMNFNEDTWGDYKKLQEKYQVLRDAHVGLTVVPSNATGSVDNTSVITIPAATESSLSISTSIQDFQPQASNHHHHLSHKDLTTHVSLLQEENANLLTQIRASHQKEPENKRNAEDHLSAHTHTHTNYLLTTLHASQNSEMSPRPLAEEEKEEEIPPVSSIVPSGWWEAMASVIVPDWTAAGLLGNFVIPGKGGDGQRGKEISAQMPLPSKGEREKQREKELVRRLNAERRLFYEGARRYLLLWGEKKVLVDEYNLLVEEFNMRFC